VLKDRLLWLESILLIVLVITVIVVSIDRYNSSNHTQPENKTAIAIASPTPTPEAKSSFLVISANNGGNYVNLKIEKSDEKYNLSLDYYGTVDSNGKPLVTIFKTILDKNAEGYFNNISQKRTNRDIPYTNKPIFFSHKADRLALLLPNKVVVFSTTKGTAVNSIMLKNTTEIPIPSTSANIAFFSGDDSLIYLSGNGSTVLTINPNTKEVKELSLKSKFILSLIPQVM
jgi:hypothetical protein